MTRKQTKCYKKSHFEMKIKLIYIVTNLPRGPWANRLHEKHFLAKISLGKAIIKAGWFKVTLIFP